MVLHVEETALPVHSAVNTVADFERNHGLGAVEYDCGNDVWRLGELLHIDDSQ